MGDVILYASLSLIKKTGNCLGCSFYIRKSLNSVVICLTKILPKLCLSNTLKVMVKIQEIGTSERVCLAT